MAIVFLIMGLFMPFVGFIIKEGHKGFFWLALWAIFSLLALVVVQLTATHVALGQPIGLSDLPRRDFFVAHRYGNRVYLEECAHQWIPFGARQYAVILTEPIDFPPMFAHVGDGKIKQIKDPALPHV